MKKENQITITIVAQKPILTQLSMSTSGASLLRKTICDERWIILTRQKTFMGGVYGEFHWPYTQTASSLLFSSGSIVEIAKMAAVERAKTGTRTKKASLRALSHHHLGFLDDLPEEKRGLLAVYLHTSERAETRAEKRQTSKDLRWPTIAIRIPKRTPNAKSSLQILKHTPNSKRSLQIQKLHPEFQNLTLNSKFYNSTPNYRKTRLKPTRFVFTNACACAPGKKPMTYVQFVSWSLLMLYKLGLAKVYSKIIWSETIET